MLAGIERFLVFERHFNRLQWRNAVRFSTGFPVDDNVVSEELEFVFHSTWVTGTRVRTAMTTLLVLSAIRSG